MGEVARVDASTTWRDILGRWAVRWGIGRYRYTVDPGLYALGFPHEDSPVLVTANYKLTFDALRRELSGRDVWILVLDTRGINVWCAAGKRTFGTDELVKRIGTSELASVVTHRRIILPQLGAPGVAAHEVAKRSGFNVSWGPVEAADLGTYLDAGCVATEDMRRVRFPWKRRVELTPVEFVSALKWVVPAVVLMVLLGAPGPGGMSVESLSNRAWPPLLSGVLALLSGTLLTPLLLPRFEWRMFSAKGAEAGVLVSLLLVVILSAGEGLPLSYGDLGSAILLVVAGSSYFAMNYTGTSTYTSLHGVELEISKSVPWQAAGVLAAVALRILGGWW